MSETPEVKNAIIKSAKLSFADRGLLDCWLELDYGGTGQGFGGFCLYLPKSFTHHSIESVAGHHLYRIMQVAGVEDWSAVVGRTIRVKATNGGVESIGHIINDDWFNPTNDYANLRNAKKG